MDISHKGYTPHLFLYIFCGLLDSMWQTTAYWMMGAMSNDPAKLAYFAGFCTSFSQRPKLFNPALPTNIRFSDKSIQSAGAAGVWRADAMKVPYVSQATVVLLF
jgi:hypothetical protein